MEYINKISGYIYGFDNHKLFKGKIKLDDEGWLEGIISPWDSDLNDEKRFIFGFFNSEKVIELFELSLTNNNKALNFHAEKCINDYNGVVLRVNESNQRFYGICNIVVCDYKLDSENDFSEIQMLEKELEEFKNNMDLYGKAFYNSSIQNKDRIIKLVVDSYNTNDKIKQLLKKKM